MQRSNAWFDLQLAHVRECLKELDKKHTPQEISDAWAALGVVPCARSVSAAQQAEPTGSK